MVCMRYVNGTVELCYDVQKLDNGEVGAYLNPFDEIGVDVSADGRFFLTPPFWAVVRINVIGTASEDEWEQKNNPINKNNGVTLGFRLNLTKCCKTTPGENNSRVLDMFTLDLGDKKLRNQACYPYVNHVQLVRVPALRLPVNHDRYAVKLVVREMVANEKIAGMEDSDDFSVQAMAPLCLKPRRDTVSANDG